MGIRRVEKPHFINSREKQMNENKTNDITTLIDGSGFHVSMSTSSIRTESTIPYAYRLAKKQDGTLVLQGAYVWQEHPKSGHEWREIETVDLGAT